VQSRKSGHQLSLMSPEATTPQRPITNSTLNTAEPTIVPKPTSLTATNAPTSEVKSSGAEPPAAMKVAPATSGLTFHFSTMTSRAPVK